ncbi:hypothetical protein AB0H20_21705 [Nocardia fluminea]|uniref:hypothetical protein n=1 Tax=Nocardia fluminea TaxID=134984 RepID=UPI0033D4D397
MRSKDIVALARTACTQAQVPAARIEPIRLRDNAMLRTDTATIIRVHQRGELATAVRELRAADWFVPTTFAHPNHWCPTRSWWLGGR